MKHRRLPFISAAIPLLVALASCSPKQNKETLDVTVIKEPSSAIAFSWRQHTGDFPKDKPGYLILTTEDAITYSKVLPDFVKQKESMGFHVYVATEKDYGTGKTGNAQAAQVRCWMREFNKRAGLKYALLIGNSNPASADLPSPTIPDGERGGMEESYADLDGAWVDLYLNTTEKDTRTAWVQECTGSLLKPKFLKQGGGRKDELIMSRISYVGTEIGNGAYDLDRILEKTIRYEKDTLAGSKLDWRAQALSVSSNYGEGNWDAPWLKAAEQQGSTFEQRSSVGWLGNLAPQNVLDGRAVNADLYNPPQRRGLLATMSHGWNRGGEGIGTVDDFFRNIDPRYPSAVSVAACTGFALADNCNLGQAWLRSGGIFAIGTGWSGNNNTRVPFHTRMLTDRVSVGEAAKNEVVQYGDPSLHVLPPIGTPVCALQVSPAISGHYEERTLVPGHPFQPVTETYTFTNRSKQEMHLTAECDAAWLALSVSKLTLQPGASAEIKAASNDRAQKLAPGVHLATLRFLRDDGQRDERRLAFNLQPVTLSSCYSFDAALQDNRFPDVGNEPAKSPWHDNTSLWLLAVEKGPHWNAFVKLGDKVPGYAPEPQGKVNGALHLDNPAKPFSRNLSGLTQWRGASASLWFKVDTLPAEKKTATILAAPFTLALDAKGAFSFSQGKGGKPATLATIKPGDWHFVQLRSDIVDAQVQASLDGQPEVSAAATQPPAAALTLGSFAGAMDEVKTWSGELSDESVKQELANSDKPFASSTPVSAVTYADDGVLSVPKEFPAAFDVINSAAKLDLTKPLADAGFVCTGLRDAPEWLDFKNGTLALKPGTDFDHIDFGGYDCFLVLKATDGRTFESPLKARIPVPEVRIRINRAADNTLSITSAGGDKRPLAKGVIRFTTDGSPVTPSSPVYEKPFKADGGKVTARFFFLGVYPYAPVTLNSEFGMPRDHWKAVAVSGKGGPAKAPEAFDGRDDTAWKNAGGTLPQFFAWDLGASTPITALSVHSTIKDATGRINGYVLHASDDGKTWRKLQEGELESSPNALRVKLDAPYTARYLKLEATSLHAGTDMALTELEVYTR